jgi:hypothetical protein
MTRHPGITLQPSILTTSGGDPAPTVRIRVHHAPDCHTLRLDWPQDTSGPHLTGRPVTPTPGWDLDTTEPGVLTARRTPQAAPPPPGQPLALDITGLGPGPPTGPLTLTVTAETTPPGPHPPPLEQPVLITDTAVPAVTNFRLKGALTASRCGTATLAWSCTARTGSFYLTRFPQVITDHPETDCPCQPCRDPDGHKRAEVQIPTGDSDEYTRTVYCLKDAGTAFGLCWEGKIGADPNLHRTATQVLPVIVDQGDVDAGDLAANGTVTVLGTPQPFTHTPSDLPATYTATTDGILLLRLRHTTPGHGTVTMKTVIHPTNSVAFAQEMTVGNSTLEAHAQLPVPAGSTIDVDRPTADCTAELCWFPLGSGPLTKDVDIVAATTPDDHA